MTNKSSCCSDPATCCQGQTRQTHVPAAAAPVQSSAQSETIRQAVREGYATIATSAPGSCGCGPACCTVGSPGIAEHVGYSDTDLATLPEGTDMGLSCGNPTALASLKPGEVVVDLGSGGGMDIFLAGPRVGPAGRAIGVDMTPEMIAKSRKAIAAYRKHHNLDNVEFRLGEIEHLPLADASADVVISNCVINLSPDKQSVWNEIARVLKPGGRVAISDLILYKPLPRDVVEHVESWIGCVAGASTIEEIRALAAKAGLSSLAIATKPEYVAALENVHDPLFARIAALLPQGTALADYVTSADITAMKPQP